MRQHYVSRLDVPVDSLAEVEGVERVAEFEYDLPCERGVHLPVSQSGLKSLPLNPFLDDAVSESHYGTEIQSPADVRMFEGGADFIFLFKQALIDRIPDVFFLQRLDAHRLPVDDSPSEPRMSPGGLIHELHLRGRDIPESLLCGTEYDRTHLHRNCKVTAFFVNLASFCFRV